MDTFNSLDYFAQKIPNPSKTETFGRGNLFVGGLPQSMHYDCLNPFIINGTKIFKALQAIFVLQNFGKNVYTR
jgi:hypothetical protein